MTRRLAACLLALGLLLIAGCASADPASVSVWVVDERAELQADTLPLLESDVYSASRREVRLDAALNESVAAQLVLRALRPPAGPFNVRVSDLVGAGGAILAADAVRLYRAHYVRVDDYPSWHPAHTGRSATPALFPDVLVPLDARSGGAPFIVDGARNEIIWIDLRVPATLEAGSYVGDIEVRPPGDRPPVFSAKLRVDVLPVALPGVAALPVVCRVDPRDLLVAQLRWPIETAEQTLILPDLANHTPAVRLVQAIMAEFHRHRLNPILWGSFPKYRQAGEREVEIDWGPYDALVAGWVDGAAFDDRARAIAWPVPVSVDYPDAELSGGFDSPRYARVLSAYLAACRRHFKERGWTDRAFVRLLPPEPLSAAAVAQVRRAAGIVRQSETNLPVLAYLPADSPRALGWHNAPLIDLPDVSIWATQAMLVQPAVVRQQAAIGRRTWFVPDRPPYSGSLHVASRATDAQILPWLAYRYDCSGIWLEDAASLASASSSAGSGARSSLAIRGLLYPGVDWASSPDPLPSMRLKRLRRGLQDYDLLRLVESAGRARLADQVAEQLVPWGFADACLEHLLSTRPAGWPREASRLMLARRLLLQELVNEFEPSGEGTTSQLANLAQWGQLLNQLERVQLGVDGVSSSAEGESLRLDAFCAVSNGSERAIEGRWVLANPPLGWRADPSRSVTVPPGARRVSTLSISLAAATYNLDGVYPFELTFESAGLGTATVAARVAIAACPLLMNPLEIDGNLTDWPLATNNAAGDFRLSDRGSASVAARSFRPALATRAFMCMDSQNLYIAVRCETRPGEAPIWRGDNEIPVDGDRPWGQDVVEILLDPRATREGASGELYCLQIKPSGLLVARKGCRTEPPIGPSELWSCGARVEARITPDAWVVELAVPFEAFGPAAARNNHWGFNVTRLDARSGEYSSWSGIGASSYTPRSLGNLVLLRP